METTKIKYIENSELVHALNWRYATKKFDPNKQIPKEDRETLFESLRLSASSMGLQPYRFIRVTNADLREQLRKVSFDQSQITDASEMIVFAAKTEYSVSDIERIIRLGGELRGYDEDKLVKRIESTKRYVDRKSKSELFEWNARQAYIAMGSLLTAAAVLGIDACPMEGINGAEYDRILGLNPLNLGSLAVVTLGYRSEIDKYSSEAKVRLPMDEVFLTF